VTDDDPSSYTPEVYDLALAKTAGEIDPPTGNVVFTFTVKNEGTLPSGTYDVTDVLPAGLEFVSATDGGAETTPGTVVWNDLPNLAPGATQLQDITVPGCRHGEGCDHLHHRRNCEAERPRPGGLHRHRPRPPRQRTSHQPHRRTTPLELQSKSSIRRNGRLPITHISAAWRLLRASCLSDVTSRAT
jgi:uncharacterized repeat protein (TIGR01451 family)